jgi:hypothetical protein
VPALGNAPQTADFSILAPGQSGSTSTLRCAQGTKNSHPESSSKECVPVWKFYRKMEDTYDMNGSMMNGFKHKIKALFPFYKEYPQNKYYKVPSEFIYYFYRSLCRISENIGGMYVCQIIYNNYIP